MLDPTTKARMALGLQKIPCHSCKHAHVIFVKYPPTYTNMWCTLFNEGKRKPGSCIPNTYSHFEPIEIPQGCMERSDPEQ